MTETDASEDEATPIATVEFLDGASQEDEQEIIRRLDDGNNFPGFTTEMDAGTLWVFLED